MRLAAFVGGRWAGVEDPEIAVDCLQRDMEMTEDDDLDPGEPAAKSRQPTLYRAFQPPSSERHRISVTGGPELHRSRMSQESPVYSVGSSLTAKISPFSLLQ
jgi:hypothetical protein